MCILELSIVLMCEFRYDYIKNKYGNNSRLFYRETDSITAVGKMKDEAAGVAIEEIGGLNPKMYSYLIHENSEHKKAKGVNRIFVSKISHNE